MTTATDGAQAAMRNGRIELVIHKHLFIDLGMADRHESVDLGLNPPRPNRVAPGRNRGMEHHSSWGHAVLDDDGLGNILYAGSLPGPG